MDHAHANAVVLREQLVAHRDRLQTELTQVSDELKATERFLTEWERFAALKLAPDAAGLTITLGTPMPKSGFVALKGSFGTPTPIDAQPTKRASGNSKKEEVAEAVLKLIRERGEPMMRSLLYPALLDMGMKINSEPVLSTMLWRMRHKIVRLPGGGYWDASKPYGTEYESTRNLLEDDMNDNSSFPADGDPNADID